MDRLYRTLILNRRMHRFMLTFIEFALGNLIKRKFFSNSVTYSLKCRFCPDEHVSIEYGFETHVAFISPLNGRWLNLRN